MMTDPARIEAAARVMWLAYCDTLGWPNGQPTWDEITAWGPIRPDTSHAVKLMMAHRDLIREQAEMALAAAYPELANGTAWLAPMEATEEMFLAYVLSEVSFCGEHQTYENSCKFGWSAMRDAHLKAQGSDA